MEGFSVVSLTSTCATISHRMVSTALELDELAKPLQPGNPASQKLKRLSARVHHFRQTVDQLQECLAGAAVISRHLQGILDHSLTTCGHATAIFDKEIRSLPLPGRQQRSGLLIFALYDDFLIAYSQTSKLFLQLLTMSAPGDQDTKLESPTVQDMLETAEGSYVAMTRSIGQQSLDDSMSDDHSSQAPPAYTPAASSSSNPPPPPGAADTQLPAAALSPAQSSSSFFPITDEKSFPEELSQTANSIQRGISAFTSSLKAMTASLRPKPDPLVNPLCQAIARGDIAQARGILSQGANINGRDEHGRTALITGIQSRQTQAIEFVLGSGADVSTRDSSKHKPPLFHALDVFDLTIIKLLLNHGADPNARSSSGQFFSVEAIMTAAKDSTGPVNAVDVARLLLSSGADANARDNSGRPLLIQAIQVLDKQKQPLDGTPAAPPSLALITELLNSGADANSRDTSGQSALMLAVQQDNVALLRLLLSHGARDRSSQPPLILAVQKGRLDMVQPLLDSGADASARDNAGRSALLIAYTAMQVDRSASASETSLTTSGSGPSPEQNPKRTEQLAILRLLIRYGADVKTTDPSGMPLVATVMRDGDATIFKLFVDGGADLNAAASGRGSAGGRDGETLLLHAIDRRPADLVRILIDHGANINAADKKGRTPLVLAMTRGRWDIVRLLVQRGADVSQLGAVAPVALARACGEQGIVDLLVAKGAVAGDALEFDEEAGALERIGSMESGRERRVLRKGRGR